MEIGKCLWEAVHPFGLEHWVVLPPEHPGRNFDRRQVWNLPSSNRPASPAISEVPVESALEVTGLHEVINEAFEVFVEGVFVR
jgi:hypothetical protein